jgi:formylmethanofuran dehydrogenase subunit D
VDLQLRAVHAIRAGESTSVSVSSASSLCTDLEDLYGLGSRCEVIQIESAAGRLVVDVRTSDGSITPRIFWATSGNYAGRITRPGPSIVSIPVGGGSYRIFIGTPEGSPTALFEVVTSLQ